MVNAQPYLASLILIWALTISQLSLLGMDQSFAVVTSWLHQFIIYGASANSQKVHLESASAITFISTA